MIVFQMYGMAVDETGVYRLHVLISAASCNPLHRQNRGLRRAAPY